MVKTTVERRKKSITSSSTSLDVLDGKDDDEEMAEALEQLTDFISNLDVVSTKWKATEDPVE